MKLRKMSRRKIRSRRTIIAGPLTVLLLLILLLFLFIILLVIFLLLS